MSKKTLYNVLDHNLENRDHQDHEDIWPWEPADNDHDEYLKLGKWILEMQDGQISKHNFQKLQDWLLRDAEAIKYYVEFMLISAGLHTLMNPSRISISFPQI